MSPTICRSPVSFWSALGVVAAIALRGASDGHAEEGPKTITVEEALRQLDTQNLTLAQARGRAEEADAISRQALAAILPAVLVSGSYTRNSQAASVPLGSILTALAPPGTAIPVSDVVIQPLEAWTGSAAVRVPLLVPSVWSDYRAAAKLAEAQVASVASARLSLRSALVQTAWAAAAARELTVALLQAVVTSREHAESTARAVVAGTSAELDVLRARTDVANRQSDLEQAHADLARLERAIGVLLGSGEPTRILLAAVDLDSNVQGEGEAGLGVGVSEPQATAPKSPEALVRDALDVRPELAAQSAVAAAASAQLASARWRYAPQLSASFAAFAATEPYPTGKDWGWRATVDLSWPLFDGGFREARASQAQALIAQAESALAQQRLAVEQEVRDGLRDLEAARARLRFAVEQRRLAAEAAASARRSFEAGVTRSLDVLDANDRLYQADVALAHARMRIGTALAALSRALGEPEGFATSR